MLTNKELQSEINLRMKGKAGEFDLTIDDLMLERRKRIQVMENIVEMVQKLDRLFRRHPK
jgi:hypothetical protein